MPVTSTLLDQARNAIERKLFMMKAFHHPGGGQQVFLRGLRTSTTWLRISVELSMPATVGWKWKADVYRPQIGSSMSKSSHQGAFDERCHTPPLNSVECGFSRSTQMHDIVIGLLVNRDEFGLPV
jgi:hypothetical protein